MISLYFAPMEKKWFESWFDTPYYHLLYKNRDDKEAHQFLDLILNEIPISSEDHILDLACGKGRHAIYLSKKGFEVTGFDLSPENIKYANQYANSRLHFAIKDMRDDLGRDQYNAVFNLFTGFGYFDTDEENFLVLKNVNDSLKKGGYFLFDYLNETYVRSLSTKETCFEIEGISFKTHKEFDGRWVIKHIEVKDQQNTFHFAEKVAMYNKNEIETVLQNLEFSAIKVFGNYNLDSFTSESPRLILLCQKQ